MEKESLELLLAQGLSLEEIGKRFDKSGATVSYWLKKYGLKAAGREKHAAKGGIERARLEELVERGMTIAEISAEVGLGSAAVRYWLRSYGLRTQNSRGSRHGAIVRESRDAGRLTMRFSCARHGDAEFILEGRGHYRCKQCRVEAVARRRRKVKSILIAEAGGCCKICGYDRHAGALTFHHLDPSEKRLEINARGIAVALDKLRAEARKCVLLCANCHAEVEGGAVTLAVECRTDSVDPIHPNPG